LKLTLKNDILLVSILVLINFSTYFLGFKQINYVLGPLTIFLFPGYLLSIIFYPKKQTLKSFERIAIIFGLSLVSSPLILMLLDRVPNGINSFSVLFSTTLFILTLAITALNRRQTISNQDRFELSLNVSNSILKGKSVDKILSLFLIFSVIFGVSSIIYGFGMAENSEVFTEFYILNEKGEAGNYPNSAYSGENISVILGLINRHNIDMTYKIIVLSEGKIFTELNVDNLQQDHSWEQAINLNINELGTHKIEFILFDSSNTDPSDTLHIWVEIKNSEEV